MTAIRLELFFIFFQGQAERGAGEDRCTRCTAPPPFAGLHQHTDQFIGQPAKFPAGKRSATRPRCCHRARHGRQDQDKIVRRHSLDKMRVWLNKKKTSVITNDGRLDTSLHRNGSGMCSIPRSVQCTERGLFQQRAVSCRYAEDNLCA